jgi:hypothetical protein
MAYFRFQGEHYPIFLNEVSTMAERAIQLTEQEIQRMEAILLDRDEEEALRFLKDVIKEKLRVTATRACGPKSI